MVINVHRVDLSFNPLPASGFSKSKRVSKALRDRAMRRVFRAWLSGRKNLSTISCGTIPP
jgi:hypothetical protein